MNKPLEEEFKKYAQVVELLEKLQSNNLEMLDYTTIATLSMAISNSINIGDKLIKSINTISTSDLKLTLSELQITLANANSEIAKLKEQTLEIDKENKQLKKELEQIKTGNKPIFKNGLYYKNDHPICTGCYKNQNLQIELVTLKMKSFGNFECPNCGQKYQ